MAFAAVQETTGTAGTGSTVSETVASTGSGNLVVVALRLSTKTETCTSVTDNVGNSYALLAASDSSGRRLYIAYGVQATGGATSITGNFSGSSATKRVIAVEFSGGASSNAAVFDASAASSGSGTSGSVTLTPASSGELIVAFINTEGVQTFTAGASYTLYGGATSSSSMKGEYLLSGTTSETAPMSWTPSAAWSEIAVAFKPSGGASVNSGFFRFM